MASVILSLSLALSEANQGERKITGIAYSGGILSYGDEHIAIDLDSLQQLGRKVPLLSNHDRDKPVGFGFLSRDESSLKINGKMLANDHAAEIIKAADEGFSWQMSVHIESGNVVDVARGGEVNGIASDKENVKLYTNGIIREVSFTPTGVDNNTSAAILSLILPEKNNMEEKLKEQLAAKDAEIAALKASLEAQKVALEQQKINQRTEQLSALGVEKERAIKLSKADDEAFRVIVEELQLSRKQSAILGAQYQTTEKPKNSALVTACSA